MSGIKKKPKKKTKLPEVEIYFEIRDKRCTIVNVNDWCQRKEIAPYH